MARLAVRLPDQPQAIHTVEATLVGIGRSSQNDLVLRDKSVSRRHCRLDRTPEGYWLCDIGSSSGTFLNGEKLIQPSLLRTGDSIRVGRADLLYVCDADEFVFNSYASTVAVPYTPPPPADDIFSVPKATQHQPLRDETDLLSAAEQNPTAAKPDKAQRKRNRLLARVIVIALVLIPFLILHIFVYWFLRLR